MRDRKTQRTAVLERLMKAGVHGVTNIELNKLCLRYGARIYELRKLGHNIETIDEGMGIFRFIYHPPRPFEQLSLIEVGACH